MLRTRKGICHAIDCNSHGMAASGIAKWSSDILHVYPLSLLLSLFLLLVLLEFVRLVLSLVLFLFLFLVLDFILLLPLLLRFLFLLRVLWLG